MALSRAIVAVTSRSLSAAGADITLTQYRTLIILTARGPQRVADLAAELAVQPSTITRLCDRLASRGLATRLHGGSDRRAVWVSLTPGGQQLVGQVMIKRRELLSDLLAQLELDDPEGFAEIAERLALIAGEPPESQWWQRWEQSTQRNESGGRS
jgi:DNA-binding MarR family transcriptional regulator